MRTTRQKRQDRVKALYRADVLAAALEIFTEKGYEQSTMQEIARKAEMAVGSLYNVFTNKEALYSALASDFVQSLRLTLDAALDEGSSDVDKLRNYVEAKGEFLRQNLRIARLYFGEMRAQESGVGVRSDAFQEMRTHFEDRLTIVFSAAIEAGSSRFADEDAYALALALQNLTNAFAALAMRQPERHPYPRTVWPILEGLFEGLLTTEPGEASTATRAPSQEPA